MRPALVLACVLAVAGARAGETPLDRLPDQLLKIELRCVQQPAATPPRDGDLVFGTAHPASGVAVATRGRPGPMPLAVVVANGESALLRWADPDAAWDLALDGVLGAVPAGRTPRPPADPALLAVRLIRRVQSLQLQPRWPGGEQPVRIAALLAAEPGGAALRTAFDAPLSRWTPLARLQSPRAGVGEGAADACGLQLRVRLLP